MRIISGKLKGKSISFLKNFTTRPLKNIVKENIFNIINHSNFINTSVEKSNVLDLYSGIGSFGIECISRGAKKVIFVEQDKKAVETLKENIDKLSITGQTEVFHNKIENFLNQKSRIKYNIFFLDPPFIDKTFIQNLERIKKKNIFRREHLIIIHREKKSKDALNEYINTLFIKKYGRSKIIFAVFN
tara:strand:- start:184 stop:744 length:561 start_codon:yes stop_codon:yes gene_type:complete